MSAEATAMPSTAAAAAAAFTQPVAGSLPAGYVEADPGPRSAAQLAHILGIFGILGTGIYYAVKGKDAGPFAKDQMKEAFNFQLLVFCTMLGLNIASAVAGQILGLLSLVFGLATLAVFVGVIVLLIKNAMKAGKGEVARYPARIPAIK